MYQGVAGATSGEIPLVELGQEMNNSHVEIDDRNVESGPEEEDVRGDSGKQIVSLFGIVADVGKSLSGLGNMLCWRFSVRAAQCWTAELECYPVLLLLMLRENS